MVKLRLTRTGKKKQPSYRLVAAPSRSPRDGRFIEILGHYNPLTDPPTVVFKEDRILHWLKDGAQATDSVRQLLETAGIWTKFTGKPVVYPTRPAAPVPAAAPEPVPANA
jgi:small subunit ribosomal protein S16